MTPENFCFWMQSLFEVAKMKSFDEEQTRIIAAHLKLVFVHSIDPSMGDVNHQKILNEIHESGKAKLQIKTEGTGNPEDLFSPPSHFPDLIIRC